MRQSFRQTDRNSLNFIKLIAAIQVFLQHAPIHMDVAYLPNYFRPFYGMFNGVPIFFIISGFLIWKSIERTDKISTFLKKRLFRLYPELWMGVFLSFVVIIILYAQSIEWIPALHCSRPQHPLL